MYFVMPVYKVAISVYSTLGPDEIRKLLLQFCKNASDISMNSAISKIPKGLLSLTSHMYHHHIFIF